MTVNRRAGFLKIATLASLALGLTLTGCSVAPENAQVTDVPTVSASASASASATASPAPTETLAPAPVETITPAPAETPVTETVAPVAPIASPAVPETPVAPVAASKTFTFPDGHISFDYPSNWTVQNDSSHPLGVNVFDENGNKLVYAYSNVITGAIAGPATRTLFDSEKMPAFPVDAAKQGSVAFAFSYEAYPGGMEAVTTWQSFLKCSLKKENPLLPAAS